VQDDDSDRDEDQDNVSSFVVAVTPGDEVATFRFDNTHVDSDVEGDSTLMSLKPACSRTPCMTDDITETEQQWRQYITRLTLFRGDLLGARRVDGTGNIRRCLARPIP